MLLGDPSGQIFYCSHLLHATHIYFTQVRSGSSRQAQHGFGASRYLPWILPQLLLRLKLMEPGRVVVFLGWSLCMYQTRCRHLYSYRPAQCKDGHLSLLRHRMMCVKLSHRGMIREYCTARTVNPSTYSTIYWHHLLQQATTPISAWTQRLILVMRVRLSSHTQTVSRPLQHDPMAIAIALLSMSGSSLSLSYPSLSSFSPNRLHGSVGDSRLTLSTLQT